ncbi:MAG: hypothetical protein Q9181_005508 [Wetmoreana brouardii]
MSSLPSYQSDLVARIRKLLEGARSLTLSAVQQTTLIDPDVKGRSWVSRTSFPAPRDESAGPQSLLNSAIETLGDGRGQYTMPPVEAVDARWTGHRPGVKEEEPEPAISEQEKYRGLMKDLKRPLTIMYFFGGGQEQFADSAKLAAEQAARQGVQVWYEEYEEMPHDFPIMSATWPWAKTEGWPQSVKCMERWVNVCRAFGQGGRLRTGAVMILTQGGEQEMDMRRLTIGVEKSTLLAQEKQAGWKAFTGPEKAMPSL